MTLADVNVLIYAFRPDAPQHQSAKAWLHSIIASDDAFGISHLALSAVVRIVTQASAFKAPNTLPEAFAYCNNLLSQPNCRPIEAGDRHWSIFERLCEETNTRGKKVSDIWYAALAIEHGCTFITYDGDFARFPGLRWRRPD